MVRYIGIRHRTKKTAAGEARPTQVCVIAGGQPVAYDLATETDELDWLLGCFPRDWMPARQTDNLDKVPEHHRRWRKVRKSEDLATLSGEHLLKEEKDKTFILEVPASFDGLRAGDTVGMALGGSGDRLAFALSRQAEELAGGTRVLRLPAAALKERREELGRGKEEDALTLAELARDSREDFFPVTRRDRDLISLGEAWRGRVDAMKARIGAEQRLRSHLIGQIFCSQEGRYPEGEVELLYEERRASDRVVQALLREEKERKRELARILEGLDVYQQLLAPIKGVGPMIAARLIVAVGDPRRFATPAKLKAFLGAHVLQGGVYDEVPPEKQFPRRRHGIVANWHPDGRQALYLLTQQFNRQRNSPWGQKLCEYKEKLRAKHPVVECSTCGVDWEECRKDGSGRHVRRYTKGHIHKMASWRTATKFVEWLWREWTRLERRAAEQSSKAA